ncbi:hypothetical protein OOK27_22215 [Streptomyces canus]|nr:hypothetical protein [Streptomyces canus]MCX5256815.1 hypothetical protein [Streptomyces canus]
MFAGFENYDFIRDTAGLSHPQALALIDLYLDTVTVGLMPRPRS